MIRLYDILKDIFSQREYKKTMFEDHIVYNIFSEEYAFRHLSREIDYDIFAKNIPIFYIFKLILIKYLGEGIKNIVKKY